METKLKYIIELDEWLPSYPGDPLVRPATYSIEFFTDNVEELDEWMAEMCGDTFVKTKSLRAYNAIGMFGGGKETYIDQWLVVYEFKEKKDFMVVKLAWYGR